MKNLPEGTDDDKLNAMFGAYGEIESSHVKKSEGGELKQTGFVMFKESDSAKKAIEELNKKVLVEGQPPLFITKFLSKKDMELQSNQPHSYIN